MGRALRLFTFICIATLVAFFCACGGSSSNTASTTSPSASGGGSSSGAGSSGSSSSPGSASPGTGSGGLSSSFVAYAYTGGTSEIRAYGVSSNGTLTPVSGSPFSFSTALNETIVTNGSNLYASDTSNSNINIFSINRSTGSLNLASTTSALAGDPNSMMYTVGLALDHTGSSLYVNLGLSDQDSGINLFAVGSGSTAQEVKFLDTGAYAQPPLVFSPDNRFAYSSLCTARVDGVFGYARASDGTLTRLSSASPVPGPTGIQGVGFCPGPLAVSARGYMAIVWLPDAMGSSVQSSQPYLVTYKINSDGTLSEVSNSQVPTASTSSIGGSNSFHTIALNFDPSGGVLAVAGDGGVQTYSLNGNGALTPASGPLNGGVSFLSVAWDNANHVFATTSAQLYVYSSTSGVLAPVSGSPYAGDQNLAVLPLQ